MNSSKKFITLVLVCLILVQLIYIYYQKHIQYNANVLKKFDFNSEEDVLVFLHIQKTGGSVFNRHLVDDLRSKIPCTNCTIRGHYICNCVTKNGNIPLFSRFSTGWICGVHPYWTDLQECLDNAMNEKEQKHRQRKYHYIAMLRDPISRYLSELAHINSNQQISWRRVTRLLCNGRMATKEEVPYCFPGDTWENLDLHTFTNCEYNLAHNRQTRMLADMKKVNCYNKTSMAEEERNKIMLQSAKENLANLDFFGLTEFQEETQILFEYTFNMKFSLDLEQHNNTVIQSSKISDYEKKIALPRNKLDIELYSFAKFLFFKRLDLIRNNEKRNPK